MGFCTGSSAARWQGAAAEGPEIGLTRLPDEGLQMDQRVGTWPALSVEVSVAGTWYR
jgi:hypothetical protein